MQTERLFFDLDVPGGAHSSHVVLKRGAENLDLFQSDIDKVAQ